MSSEKLACVKSLSTISLIRPVWGSTPNLTAIFIGPTNLQRMNSVEELLEPTSLESAVLKARLPSVEARAKTHPHTEESAPPIRARPVAERALRFVAVLVEPSASLLESAVVELRELNHQRDLVQHEVNVSDVRSVESDASQLGHRVKGDPAEVHSRYLAAEDLHRGRKSSSWLLAPPPLSPDLPRSTGLIKGSG
jgi:hypothetical protein